MKKKMKGDVYARNGPGAIRWILRWLSREIACRVLPSPICPWSKTRKIQSHELITEDDVDAEAVAADEPGNAIELVRLEVRRDAKVGEADSLALRVG
jgi:hypothetical protein